MSSKLDIDRLECVCRSPEKIIARCPACAELGEDKKGQHLCIFPDDRYACIKHPGEEGRVHRARIYQLSGLPEPASQCCKKKSKQSGWTTLDGAIAKAAVGLAQRETRRWIYREADGRERLAVVRFDDADKKEYRPFHTNGSGWRVGDPQLPLPLFNLPQLITRSEERVFVVEGEKCADALGTLGLLTTTSAHGAKAAHKSDWRPLALRDVVIIPDNDEDGRDYARKVADILLSLPSAARVQMIELPGLPPKGDAVEWLEERDAQLLEDILRELHDIVAGALFLAPPRGEKASAIKSLPPDNDAGNAILFLDRFADRLRYVPSYDWWLIWDGSRWKRDEDGSVLRLAVQLSQLMLSDAARILDHKDRSSTAERGIRLGNTAKISSMLHLAKCDERIVVLHSKLDFDPWLLGVENGVIDLRTGGFRQGCKDDFILKVAGCAYKHGALAPRWLQFLCEIFANDQEIIDYVRKLIGYTLTGKTDEQIFLFLHGEGANGKTTFIETLAALLGTYGQRAPQTLLVTSDHGHEPRNEIARLHGARLVVSSETCEGDRLAENRIKDMTGGDTLTGRFLYRESFDFVPVLKLWMFGNHRPEIRGTDHGIWRRVRLIPFNVQIDEDRRERSLLNKLREELPGILNWAVDGCLSWQRDGLIPPSKVSTATSEYREDEDILRDFLTEVTEHDNGGRIEHARLYNRYEDWCSENGVRFPMQTRTFSRRLRGRGYRHERTGEGVRWAGIKLK